MVWSRPRKGHVRSGIDQDRSGQVRSRQDSSVQGHVRADQVRIGKPRQLKSGQTWLEKFVTISCLNKL